MINGQNSYRASCMMPLQVLNSYVKISISRPNIAHCCFDFECDLSKYVSPSIEILGARSGFRSVTVGRGGTEQNSHPQHVAARFYTFDAGESFIPAIVPHADELLSNMQHYTNTKQKFHLMKLSSTTQWRPNTAAT